MEQDVLDCLDHYLAFHGRHARVDTAGAIIARDLVAKFEERARKEVTRQLQYVPAAKRRPVYIFFCEDQSYGAFAVRDRYDYIVLHIGIVPAIIDFCDRMMENPRLWTNINPPAGPTGKRTRLAFAIVFASECFDIIVRHELAHLALGHCEFLAVNTSDDALTAQALEVAADGHAVNWGAQKLPFIRQMLGRRSNAVDQAYREFHRSTDEAVRNYLLAVYFVFRLMDETAWSGIVLKRRPHPPAPIRFHVACLHLQEYYEQAGDTEGQARLTRAMQEIWELGEFIFAETLEQTPDLNAKRQVMEVESEQHFALVHERAMALPQSLFGLS